MLKIRKETMGKLEDFLETIPSKYTRKNYKNGIKKFESWYGKSIVTLIGNPEASKIIEKFYVYLKEKHCQNTARNQTNAVIQFLKYYKTPLEIRKALGIYRTETSLKDHLLTIEELRKMYDLANLKEKVVLELGLLGFRISDVIILKKSDFNLNQEAPIEFKRRARKEGTIYHTFISKELKELLELYLPTLKGEYLFEGQRKNTHSKAETLNKILKDLAKRSSIQLHGNLHWHCFRKLILRRGSELGIPSWNLKLLTGKSVPYSDETYLAGINLKEDFLRLHNDLNLRRTANNNKLGNLEETVNLIAKALARLIMREVEMKFLIPPKSEIELIKRFLEGEKLEESRDA
jgi:integrase